jgi:hypothetical protein
MMKLYFPILLVFVLNSVRAQIAAWDFTGENAVSTSPAEVYNLSMDASNLMTRGSTATASAGANSFRTVGFMNNGISTDNTDYFQITLSAVAGFSLSLSTIDARFQGTGTFFAAPGVTSQFAYSLDGSNFTLIGSSVTSTSLTMVQIDLSGIAALQNVSDATTITIRYYASGQTATGGWGFNSPSVGQHGLAVGGSLNANGALPVKFADVRGYTQGSGIRVEWSNMTESNVLGYKFERSINGTDFYELSTVPATKNDGARADYSFFDAFPVNGINYYRVQSHEEDGGELNSEIVRVDTKAGISGITIFPNPVTSSQLSLRAHELRKGDYTLRIFNTSGQQVFGKVFIHAGNAFSEVMQLPGSLKPGVYNLIISSGEMKLMKFFIIR